MPTLPLKKSNLRSDTELQCSLKTYQNVKTSINLHVKSHDNYSKHNYNPKTRCTNKYMS